MTPREQIVNFLSVISSVSELLSYERNVPIAYVPIEITEQFLDLFQPKDQKFANSFSSDELIDIAKFSGYLDIAADAVLSADQPPTIDVLKIQRWREMMQFARKLLQSLNN